MTTTKPNRFYHTFSFIPVILFISRWVYVHFQYWFANTTHKGIEYCLWPANSDYCWQVCVTILINVSNSWRFQSIFTDSKFGFTYSTHHVYQYDEWIYILDRIRYEFTLRYCINQQGKYFIYLIPRVYANTCSRCMDSRIHLDLHKATQRKY